MSLYSIQEKFEAKKRKEINTTKYYLVELGSILSRVFFLLRKQQSIIFLVILKWICQSI